MTLSGRLNDVSIIDIVRSIRLGDRTGTLTITADDQIVALGFDAGRIAQVAGPAVKAMYSEVGRKARGLSSDRVRELLREVMVRVLAMIAEWPRGSFTFTDGARLEKADSDRAGELPRVSIDPQDLLPVAAKLADERKRSRIGRRLRSTPGAKPPEPAPSSLPSLANRALDAEHLLRLYVATYQLHASLSIGEVQLALKDILVNLLGVESFVLLLRNDEDASYAVAMSEGPGAYRLPREGVRYLGGLVMLDRALADGVLVVASSKDSELVAAVPLRFRGETVGALAIMTLFGHKPGISTEDHDVLEMLGLHGASALHAAQLFSRADQRIRSLESVIHLLRRD